MNLKQLKQSIANVPNFPHPPVMFRDLSTLLLDPEALQEAIQRMKMTIEKIGEFDLIAGIESRGFIIGTPLAYLLHKGFIIIRKKGKLPRQTLSQTYDTEYGPDTIEMHQDAVKTGQKVVLIDDLLATGGTALAACRLIEQAGAKVSACVFLNELTYLSGRHALQNYKVRSIITFDQ